MRNFTRPKPIDKEIILDKSKTLLSKTNIEGVIEYVNKYFIEVSGYEEWELVAEHHRIIAHPDMPKAIFKLIWSRLKKGENIHALVKNLAKDGRFYWEITSFDTKYDQNGNIKEYFYLRKASPRYAVKTIIPIYKNLVEIEEKEGIEASELFLSHFLSSHKLSYNEFILKVLKVSQAGLEKYFNIY